MFLWAVRSGARVRKVSLGSVPGADTRKSVCGAGFDEWLAMGNCSKKAIFLQLGIKTARHAQKLGVFGIHKMNYVVKTTELGEETARRARKRGVFGIYKTNYVVETTELGRKPRGMRGVLIFRSTAEKMGQAAACWRAKSADGGGNRRTSAKKNTRGRCGQQMESCAGGGTLSKKCAKNANWTGAAALSPQRRGYAAKIMRRKNARRKFGKRASGESHYRNPCGIIRNIW